MAKALEQVDVVVLGDHPSAYFAAAVLKQKGGAGGVPLRVAHCCIPGEHHVDRLVMFNPSFFSLHSILGPLKRKLDLTPVYGLTFLSNDPESNAPNLKKTIGAYTGTFKQIHGSMVKMAREAGIEFHKPKRLEIRQVDETGVKLGLDSKPLHAKLLLLAGELDVEARRMLGLQPSWDTEVMHRYTFLNLKGAKWLTDAPRRGAVPMCLDVGQMLSWGWLLTTEGQAQVAVEQSASTLEQHPPLTLLRNWLRMLVQHGFLSPSVMEIELEKTVIGLDLPLCGALAQEGVANRTLLIGPAGGFYTACSEDIYPNCWSSVHAVEIARKALREKHLQDALGPYRQLWGATLGDYLRGPQQNLRFLLPLVYRNATMRARLMDAILSGKSVVR